MAIEKSSSAVTIKASTSCAVGVPEVSSSFEIKYGYSVAAKITNGASPPVQPCGVYLECSADGSAWYGSYLIGLGDSVANSVTEIPVNPALVGMENWKYFRLRFAGNTSQPVDVQAYGSSTTGL